jgi:hypothetical protein
MSRMLKYRTTYNAPDGKDLPTWGLMPMSKECPFVDGVWNPQEKVLTLLVDSSKSYFIDKAVKGEDGQFIKDRRTGALKVKEVQYPKYYEHHLNDQRDVDFFMETFVTNNFDEETIEEKELS